jgi:hypothetical protein
MGRSELRELGEAAAQRRGRQLGLRDRLLWESAIKIMFIACVFLFDYNSYIE